MSLVADIDIDCNKKHMYVLISLLFYNVLYRNL
jgi:hypothetical protein